LLLLLALIGGIILAVVATATTTATTLVATAAAATTVAATTTAASIVARSGRWGVDEGDVLLDRGFIVFLVKLQGLCAGQAEKVLVGLIVLEEMSGCWIAGDDGVGDKLLAPRDERLHEAVASFVCLEELVKGKLILFAAMTFVAGVTDLVVHLAGAQRWT
jgi:hypothetical protein